MKKFNLQDSIALVNEMRHLHFANPRKEDLIRKLEYIRPKDFSRVVRLLVGNNSTKDLSTKDIKIYDKRH